MKKLLYHSLKDTEEGRAVNSCAPHYKFMLNPSPLSCSPLSSSSSSSTLLCFSNLSLAPNLEFYLNFILPFLKELQNPLTFNPIIQNQPPLFFSPVSVSVHSSLCLAMSSSAYQGLQSCLEPRILEQRVLRLKLFPPAPSFSRSFGMAQRAGSSNSDSREAQEKSYTEEDSTSITTTGNNKNKNNDKVMDDCNSKGQKNDELGGWSFIQALSNTSHNFKEVLQNDKVYVHPLTKRSKSMLSAKSLEMCTESLGSESGSGISQSIHEVSSPSSRNSEKFAGRDLSDVHKTTTTNSENFAVRELLDVHKNTGMKSKMTRSTSFPPPLTSISSRGGGGLQVRPHREAGRLVIEAVAIPACHSYFHAERSDGRLRLRLLKDCFQHCNNEATKEEDDEPVIEGDGQFEPEEEAVENDETDGEEEEEKIDGSSGNIVGEIELGKLPRPSRCMEGGGHTNNSLMNWESLWVATS